ncbi:uncharacterized protein LOC129571197 [Sitodiplosis mosellana]|uniref:uncharacterized protein LOC129571197 n=1 Tax=Sitodiplosis mosellana TaxID=263140 RepID=UPI002444F5D8|nr:uncharacterized protein LOC129571197 [Sitodiplosis mosellana]
MEGEMDGISRALKTIDDNNPSRTFGNSADLQNFIINALDATFVTKCSAYEQYLKEMQKPSTAMVPEGSNDEAKAASLAENSARAKIMSEGKFKNIFKFALFMFEAACKNPELFSELKTKTKKAECGKNVYITNFSGGTINTRK